MTLQALTSSQASVQINPDRTVARPSGWRIETRLDARAGKSVETSLDAADTSVRATQASQELNRKTSGRGCI
jgi:hypothetical protein